VETLTAERDAALAAAAEAGTATNP
jgi:hypothetical protein